MRTTMSDVYTTTDLAAFDQAAAACADIGSADIFPVLFEMKYLLGCEWDHSLSVFDDALRAAGSGCSDGSDEATFEGLESGISIAACAGSFAGTVMDADAASVCADGWHVCTGGDIVESGLTHEQGRSFAGCFVYNAANDCNGVRRLRCDLLNSIHF